MMTVTKLFFQRLVAEWKYQYQVWKTAVDWIVALYILIPFFAIFLNYYVSWWRKAPGWLDYIPLTAFLGIILVFAWSGTIRIFLEEADQLFLLQRKAWISQIIRYSLGYSVIYNLFATSLMMSILAPFLWRYYSFSLAEIILIVFFIFVLKNCLGLAKQLVELRFKGWPQRMVKWVMFLIIGGYVRTSVVLLRSRTGLFCLLGLILLIILGILLYQREKVTGSFFEDVLRERQARLRLAKFMLQQVGTYVKKPRFSRKRPLLFRTSRLLFKKRNPVNGLVEMCLKAVLRNESDVGFYLKLVGVYLVMILVFPGDLKWLLWIVFSIMLTNVVGISWLEVINSPFVCLFPWLPGTKLAAARKAIFLMALPGQLLLGLVVVLQTHSWIGALGLVPSGLVIGYFTAKRVSLKF
ncbi:ABC transporter permease [Desulfosporosinus sp. BG]|uniref:ABC transporter permease n=1 Tax=Desulfosporosinus sp. BG TaxID=1633135 RepID=UPI00083B1393|nr:ABC transporter permease [Desulfosporosinus sp. BG]ODA42436.1 Protein ecsB [Desulfosporosinus sp. BG]